MILTLQTYRFSLTTKKYTYDYHYLLFIYYYTYVCAILMLLVHNRNFSSLLFIQSNELHHHDHVYFFLHSAHVKEGDLFYFTKKIK
jgi:hypothetical protein